MRIAALVLLPWLLAGADEFALYPSGPRVPTNTKLLMRVPCCASQYMGAVTVRAGSDTVVGRLEGPELEWLVFTPAELLKPETAYTVEITPPNRPRFVASFTTGAEADSAAPQLVSSWPVQGGDTGGVFGSPIVLEFSEPLHPVSVQKAVPTVEELGGRGWVYGTTASLGADGRSIRVSSPLGPGAVYRIRYADGVPEDLAGNRVATPPDFVFTTYPDAPKDGPKIRATLPLEEETEVPTNAAIFLQFDRPVLKPEDGAFSLGSEGDASVGLTAELLAARNALILRPTTLLRPNQRYTLRVNRFYDAWGGAMTAGTALSFTTALLPELRPFREESGPAGMMPRSATVQWRYNRALNPWVLPVLIALPAPSSDNALRIPTRLLADGMTLEAEIPGLGEYVLSGGPYDRVQSRPLGGFASAFQITAVRDLKAPIVVFTLPPDQSSGVPPEIVPAVQFNEAIRAEDVALWRGGERVRAEVSSEIGGMLQVKPATPLEDGAEYCVEVRGPRDGSGNTAADVTWTFRVSSATPGEDFQLVSVEPAAGSIGVPTGSDFTLTFNRPPNPRDIACSTMRTGVDSIPGRWTIQNERAVFRPDFPLPGGKTVRIDLCSPTDLRGQPARRLPLLSFTTRQDGEAPGALRVQSITPGDGEFTLSGDRSIALEFTEPLAESSLGPNPVRVTGADGQDVARGVQYLAAERLLVVATALQAEGHYEVTINPGLRSVQGAATEPFTARVEIRPKLLSFAVPPPTEAPQYLRSVELRSVSRDGAIIVVYFHRPMERTLVDAALRVVSAEKLFRITRADWTPDSRAVVLSLEGPVTEFSTSVWAVLSLASWGRAGSQALHFSLSVPIGPQRSFRLNVTEPFASMPSDGLLEVEFAEARPPDYVRLATATIANGAPARLEVVQRTPTNFRLRPQQPFPAGSMITLNIETEGGERLSMFVSTWKMATPETREIFVGPTLEMGEVPVNAVIWLQSKTVLNPLTVRPVITVDGEVLPFTAEVLDLGFLIVLRPPGLLRGNAVYQVSLSGVEDQAGRPIPDRTWWFRTSAGPDFTPTLIESWGPSGSASPDVAPWVMLTHPVMFRRGLEFGSNLTEAPEFRVVDPSFRVEGTIEFSDDARTVTLRPDGRWPASSRIQLPVSRFTFLNWTMAPVGDAPSGRDRTPVLETGP